MARHSFSTLPSSQRRRVRFRDDWDVTTSMSVGKLYPIKLEEVVPGDDFKEDITSVARLTSAYLRPVMDDVFLDVYAFFIPGRILYDDFESVFGNPSPSAYVDNDLGSIPTLPSGLVVSKSVGDYLGLPVGQVPSGLSVLPFRAFAMVYNQWFRNENTNDETFVQTGARATSEALNSGAWSPSNYCGMLPSVGKIKDYFTSCVPQPQKGSPVTLPIQQFPNVPVYTSSTRTGQSLADALHFRTAVGTGVSLSGTGPHSLSIVSSGSQSSQGTLYADSASGSQSADVAVFPDNLFAQTSNLQPTIVSVDELRLATQRQLMLVADTMYGSRYREYIYGHYGVNIGDNTVQIPEYLCGKRVPLNVAQVAQTTPGTDDSSLASLGGYSFTVSPHNCNYFKGFKEHGYVLWVGCLRQRHTYQQGVHKLWSRTVRDDFYDPLYAHIGYQPVYTSELYITGQQLKGNIFGWQEAWSEYKHSLGVVSGECRSSATESFDIYHFADNYSSAPVIGQEFNDEVPKWVDRTLAVPSTSQDQFIVQFHCNSYKTRVMPVYCEPGYMDHWNK